MNRLHSGLLSVSFRQLKVEEIIKLVAQAELTGIEWGGDIHAPHGDSAKARQVGTWTVEHGLKVVAYGSYYRVGDKSPDAVPFEAVLDSAVALGAPTVRVWAGSVGSAKADPRIWDEVVTDSRRIAELAKDAGITVSYEYHANTLTDTADAASKLLRLASHSHLCTLWQPTVELSHAERLLGLERILPMLGNVHVFHWEGRERRPLVEGADTWRDYFQCMATQSGERYAMLEFIKDDDPSQFLQDAKVLKRLLEETQG